MAIRAPLRRPLRRGHGPVQQRGLRVRRSPPAGLADGMGGHAGGDVASSTVIGAARAARRRGARRPRRQPRPARAHPRAPTPRSATRPHADPSLDGHGHHAHRPAPRRQQDRARPHRRLARVHAARRRGHPDHQGPLLRAEPRRRGPDHRRRGADATRSAPSSPGCSPAATTTSPTSSVREGRIGDRYLICLRRPHRLRRARHHRGGAHRRRRPGRDRRPAGRAGPAGRRPRQRHRRRRRPRRHRRQRPAHPAPGGRRGGGARRPAPGRSRRPRPPRPRPSPRRPPAAADDRRRGHPGRGGAALARAAPCCAWPPSPWCSLVVVAGGSYAGVRVVPAPVLPRRPGRRRRRLPRASSRTSARSRCPAPEYATTIAIDDLPTSYQDSLEQGIEVDDRAAADARVAELRLQATACRWAQLNGEACRTVPADLDRTDALPEPHASPTRRRPPRRPPRPPSRRATPTRATVRPRCPRRRRDRRTGDLMSIVSSHAPRTGRNVELALRRRRRRHRAAGLPQRRARHHGHDPARHAHPGRRLPRAGPRLPPRAALARRLRRPAAAADRHRCSTAWAW